MSRAALRAIAFTKNLSAIQEAAKESVGADDEARVWISVDWPAASIIVGATNEVLRDSMVRILFVA